MKMRELKFRAWNKKDKRITGNIELGDAVVDFTGYILMQFTGLKDKNGKEIYEGDILIHHYYHENGIVIWHTAQSRWALEYFDKKTQELFPIDKDSFEVIGNIYKNLELLGEIK
jgi:uncharacterized phage protein (TIGR01671 family)